MRRGFHLVDVAEGFRPTGGLSWSWRWVGTDSGRTVGIAFVGQHRMLMVLWRTVMPLNTMKLVSE